MRRLPFRFEVRPEPSRLAGWLSPVIAAGATRWKNDSQNAPTPSAKTK